MFDTGTQKELGGWMATLAELPGAVASDAERIDRITELEELKAAAAAAQARLTADFDAAQRKAQAEAGRPARRQGEGIASQIALARHESPVRGAQHLGLAKILTGEMPHALTAMTQGRLSEWRATLLARETACLSVADRRIVDAALCADPKTLEGLSDGALVAAAQRLVHRLDAESVVRRNRKAETERHVSIRPAPDTMTWVTALLPVAQGVALYAALTKEADRLRAAGDSRTRGQVMADTLVGRVTGLCATDPVPVSVGLVITDRSLLAGDTEPAHLDGYGVVPAQWARDHITSAATDSVAWFRRIYTTPTTGDLVAMDSRARHFPTSLRRLIDTRDGGLCRTPWCGAPIRHHDHITPKSTHGPTSATNGQGLCERCNYARQALGWHSRPRPGPRHTVVVTTPTGHTHTSTAPPLPGTPSTSRLKRPRVDLVFSDLTLTLAA